jgi:hypothetical protein
VLMSTASGRTRPAEELHESHRRASGSQLAGPAEHAREKAMLKELVEQAGESRHEEGARGLGRGSRELAYLTKHESHGAEAHRTHRGWPS